MSTGTVVDDNERERLAVLRSYEILDTGPEPGFDDLVRLASDMCSVPMSAVSMVDADRQWFKAGIGLNVTETPRSMSFCQHAMVSDDLMIVPDARLDPRFADNPLVTGPAGIRFYAGAPLVSPDGYPLGALCVIDTVPRELSTDQALALTLLGRQATAQLALRQTVRNLTASEQRFRTVFHRAPIGMVLLSPEPGSFGTLLEVNAEFAAMLGHPPEALQGRSFFDLVDPADQAAIRAGFAGITTGGERAGYRDHCRFLPASGLTIVAKVAGAWIQAEAGAPDRIVVQVEDVTVTRAAQDELAYLAAHDPLTGLANRTEALRRLRNAQTQADTTHSGYVGLLFIDLDRFKVVNDSLGHQAGDELLTTVASRLTAVIRSGDLAARIGGDEFVIICEDLGPTASGARQRAEGLARRVEKAIAVPVQLHQTEVFVSASVGMALCPGGEQPAEDLLRDADAAMYAAKARGSGRVEMFDTGLRAISVQRQTLESGLHRALERRELVLHYQPVVDLVSGRPAGAEALLRWRHPERGLLGPDAFIAVAEETGLIVPIGAWVLEQACRDLVSWRDGSGADLTVAVNVSARQLAHSNLASTVAAALSDHGLVPGALNLEVTETALLDITGPVHIQLERLRALGVGLGIDDFGTGYASLTYLKKLPVDFVKIDKSFVADLGSSQSDTAIVAAVLSLASSLGLEVIAEGVERSDQAVQLAAMGCRYGQGFLWSRPVPFGQLRRLHDNLRGGHPRSE